MIWFLSWVAAIWWTCLGGVVYLYLFDVDPGLLTREINELTPLSWHWRPGAYSTPVVELCVYVVCLILTGWKRSYLRKPRRGERNPQAVLLGLAQYLFANPAGRRLTQWCIPLVIVPVTISAPLVQVRDGLSPLIWGFCALFGITLIGTALVPDPAPRLDTPQTPPTTHFRRSRTRRGWPGRRRLH
jgi:hypothetical protein